VERKDKTHIESLGPLTAIRKGGRVTSGFGLNERNRFPPPPSPGPEPVPFAVSGVKKPAPVAMGLEVVGNMEVVVVVVMVDVRCSSGGKRLTGGKRGGKRSSISGVGP